MTSQLEIFEHFGVKQTSDLVKGDTFNRTKDTLSSAIIDHGWVAFAGPIGSGKTVTVYNILRDLQDRQNIAFVEIRSPNRKGINETHLMHSMILELGDQFLGDTSIPRSKLAQTIKIDRIIKKAKQKNYTVCLVIDEAQELVPETFNIIKRFRDVKLMNTGNTISVVLLGQPALVGKVEQNEEVTQRCKTYEFEYTQAEKVLIAQHYGNGLITKEQAREVAEKAVNGRGIVTPLSIIRCIEDAMENAYKTGDESLSMYHFEFRNVEKRRPKKSRGKIEVKSDAAKKVAQKYTKEAS